MESQEKTQEDFQEDFQANFQEDFQEDFFLLNCTPGDKIRGVRGGACGRQGVLTVVSSFIIILLHKVRTMTSSTQVLPLEKQVQNATNFKHVLC